MPHHGARSRRVFSWHRTQKIAFTNTFCGDWAGNTFSNDCPHIAQSCEEFVATQPHEFKEAYWKLRALNVYQRSEE